MQYSQSLLRSAVLLAVVVAAGCDRDVESVMAPAKVPSGPNALIVPTGYSDVSVGNSYACAVRAVDGGLVCWGDNEYLTNTPPAGMGTCIIAADQKGDSTWAYARATQTVTVIWPFSGFFAPVYNPPTVNVVPAGRYVQASFSLAGNRETGSFVVPSVTSYVVPCTPNAPSVNITTFGFVTPGIVYDVNTARYVISFGTVASWAGTCRTYVVTLKDGTTHTLTFKFT